MGEVRFYAVARGSLERTLRVMLERTLAREERAVVRARGEARLAELDAFLWQDPPERFLPHGGKEDGFPEQQPVYLTTGEENPNGARVLFQVQEGEGEGEDEGEGDLLTFPPSDRAYDLACLLFAASDEAACARAQALWERSPLSTFWRQDARGAWQKSEHRSEHRITAEPEAAESLKQDKEQEEQKAAEQEEEATPPQSRLI